MLLFALRQTSRTGPEEHKQSYISLSLSHPLLVFIRPLLSRGRQSSFFRGERERGRFLGTLFLSCTCVYICVCVWTERRHVLFLGDADCRKISSAEKIAIRLMMLYYTRFYKSREYISIIQARNSLRVEYIQNLCAAIQYIVTFVDTQTHSDAAAMRTYLNLLAFCLTTQCIDYYSRDVKQLSYDSQRYFSIHSLSNHIRA